MVLKNGLIVKQPFADKIVNGEKTWEIRSRIAPRTKINKEILLLSAGYVLGTITIKKCFKSNKSQLIKNKKKHLTDIDEQYDFRYSYVWEIIVKKKYSTPKKYSHPIGARIWVKNVDFFNQKQIFEFFK